jgi:hypothetical protein
LLLSLPHYLDLVGLAKQRSIKIDPFVSLAVVVALLVLATIASVLWPRRDAAT